MWGLIYFDPLGFQTRSLAIYCTHTHAHTHTERHTHKDFLQRLGTDKNVERRKSTRGRDKRLEKMKHERKRRGICHGGPGREEEGGKEKKEGREEEEGGEKGERGEENGVNEAKFRRRYIRGEEENVRKRQKRQLMVKAHSKVNVKRS